MIRSFKEDDMTDVRALLSNAGLGDHLLDTIINSKQFFVFYDQEGIKGISYYSIDDEGEESIAQLNVVVDPKYRLKGIGTILYNEMEALLTRDDPDFVSVYLESEQSIIFTEKMGFVRWWGSSELIFTGGPFPDPNIEFIKFEEQYFEKFLSVVQDCYYDLHVKNDIKPYVATEHIVRKYKLHNKDRVYLVVHEGEIIASVTTGDGEVDNLMVAPSHQGKGYGRKALQFALNKLLKEGCKEIRICYVEGNEDAEKLYTSVGFKPLHHTHVYRKFL
ncbi:GNAT family N-acetyltransferase [Rossellomorea aquimaris]|uniref:GNAT family N-acetyltransferase n=1 Tax=Rossellomorea aquimaris TaxID=189382 RepID=UPI001CD5477E|nr:GNAT family N-acetyltransferase [Rossellomorea aquimaris]MCA1054063.1 GNAT family N-acetyltransferase [Rossellomorea aquimaris]